MIMPVKSRQRRAGRRRYIEIPLQMPEKHIDILRRALPKAIPKVYGANMPPAHQFCKIELIQEDTNHPCIQPQNIP
jgi:hypothetical protein